MDQAPAVAMHCIPTMRRQTVEAWVSRTILANKQSVVITRMMKLFQTELLKEARDGTNRDQRLRVSDRTIRRAARRAWLHTHKHC